MKKPDNIIQTVAKRHKQRMKLENQIKRLWKKEMRENPMWYDFGYFSRIIEDTLEEIEKEIRR